MFRSSCDSRRRSATPRAVRRAVELAALALAAAVLGAVVADEAQARPLGPAAAAVLPGGPDGDDDGLSDALEAAVGTDPARPDTDSDGIRDGVDPDVLAGVVAGLPKAAFKSTDLGLRTALLSRLDAAERRLAAGDVDQTVRELQSLRTRLDGCPPRPAPDDWIVDCEKQQWLRALLDLQLANHVSVRVDTSIVPPLQTLPGLFGGPARPVGVAVGPDGTPEAFVADEVVYHPSSQAELAAFLARYRGTVLRDGTPRLLPGVMPPPGLPARTGWYLVRVDVSTSSPDDLEATMEAAGLRGSWSFSSPAAARLAALVTREFRSGVSPNIVGDLSACRSCEHADDGGGNLDATSWWWMTEDDDPSTAGEQGLSTGVVHAWEYVKYKGYPSIGIPYTPVTVAVIDAGFDLDETTGLPVGGNLDYPVGVPLQIDEVGGDLTAGGLGFGFPNCVNGCWHGQMSFGTCCGRSNDFFGTAGTSGGREIVPLVIKVSGDIDTATAGVYAALYNGADVIAEAPGWDCGWWCRNVSGGTGLRAAVSTARAHGAVFVTPSNNQGRDISNSHQYPCVLNGAICVGAVESDGKAASYSNWGTVVDTWAPTGVRTTITRESAAQDPNNTGIDELFRYGGTSASGPYLTGVVALMKMLDPTLTYDEVRTILVATANPSTDPKVAPRGYVDAYRAVLAASPNLPPTVAIEAPAPGATTTYHDVYLKAAVVDPESPSPFWIATDYPTRVTFTSNRDGVLCSATGDATGDGATLACTAASLSMGAHTITATATDPFGGVGSASVSITVANQVPVAAITFPADGASYYSSQLVNLRGYGYDWDDPTDPNLPDSRLAWRSDQVAGLLGTGRDLWVSLPAGTHHVTLTATDDLGATGTDSITIVVQAGAGYPTAQIVAPANNAIFGPDATITFTGKASDPEDGDITNDAAFSWSSSLDGPLGTGRTIQVKLSPQGESAEHVITLVVTDSDGHQATHAIKVFVISPQ